MAENDQDSGEKEFEATEQKLQRAREEGDVAQSKEVNAMALVLGLVIAALVFQGVTSQAVFDSFSAYLYHADSFSHDVFEADGERSRHIFSQALIQIGSPIAIIAACILIALVAQQSVSFSFKKIKPDPKKLSPVENIKKRYGPKGLIDFAKDAAKMLFAGGIGLVFLIWFVREYYSASALQMAFFFDFTFGQIMGLISMFAIFYVVLAAIDLPVQRQLHANKMKMTREELKKEVKQSEGDPQLKQQRRDKATKLSRREMMDNVKTATVIMTNPEHYAVALRWDPESQRAPVCVAKGVDHLAARIREIAIENQIPIYRDPPAARSMYALVDVDEEIHPEHFAAVAAAIQFVDRVRGDS